MNNFKLTAVGILAGDPELLVIGEITVARFQLEGRDYLPGDEGADSERGVVTSVWFIAFEEVAKDIAQRSVRGDQLILEARAEGNSWTKQNGVERAGLTFIVTGFRFGATRGGTGSPITGRPSPSAPLSCAAFEDAMAAIA